MRIGAQELVLHRLRPDVEEHRVGDVELAHLHRRQRDRADEDERRHLGRRASRKRVSRPWESMATPGQNVSSKTKKTFRRAMMRLRWANAQVAPLATSSPDARSVEQHFSARAQRRPPPARARAPGSRAPARPARAASAGSRATASPPRPPCTRRARRARCNCSTPGSSASRSAPAGSRRSAITSPMRIWRFSSSARPPREDPPGLDEGDLVAQLLGLAHVVGRQDDRGAPLAAERGDLGPDPDGDVGIEAERGLVEEQHLGLVQERLGEGEPLLEPGRELVVLGLPVRARARTAR